MKFIISADDFGRSHERNLAIDKAFKTGLIYSAGLMINSDYTNEALTLATNGGYIKDIHLHLNMAYGEQLSGNSKPLNREFANCNVFCENQEFKHPFYNELDFYKYVEVTYKELEAQYIRFKEITDGQGNLKHIDVHIYNNRSYPFASAMQELIKTYGIKTARYFGVHHLTQQFSDFETQRIKLASLLCGQQAYVCKSCNIDYYLTKHDEFQFDDLVELYCHPDYVNGKLLDNTESCFGHDKQLLDEHIKLLKDENAEFISWAQI